MSHLNTVMNFFREQGKEDSIVFQKTLPSREAFFAELSPPLNWRLEEILKKGDLKNLYSHQVEAINTIREGKNIVIVTKTASGKSLCYNLPVLESIISDNSTRAIYIFPTKALARNQAERLKRYDHAFYYDDFNVGIYDGDTPKEDRIKIRKKANIIITTPDMLHLGILPNHDKWKNLFLNLKYIILDEIHTYKGVFGSQICQLIRRVRRICSSYSTDPQFICCSATIGNPLLLASKITQKEFKLIDNNGAPSGEKTFIFWDRNRNDHLACETSINMEASSLFYHLLSSNIRTIVFTLSRSSSELILKTTRDLLSKSNCQLMDRITSYRGGYIPSLRRQIERKLSTGELLGVVSTSALEIGVDIGSLDACIIVGFPRNIMSAWQQVGRVGRSKDKSIVILMAGNSQKDQHYFTNCEDFFSPSYEIGVIDSENPYILNGHLNCASYELPIDHSDLEFYGNNLFPFIRAYTEKNYLFYKNNKFYWNIEDYYPAESFGLRTFSDKFYQIVNYSPPYNILGTTNTKSSDFFFHRDAIYIHQGETFKVIELDERRKKIYVTPEIVHYYTKPQITSEVEPGEIIGKSPYIKNLYLSELKIIEKCVSYRKIDLNTGKFLKTIPLPQVSEEMETKGIYFSFSEEIQKELLKSGHELIGSINGTGNILSFIISIITLCDVNEIGAVFSLHNKITDKPTLFIYDRFPGGLGYTVKGFELFPKIVKKATELIKNCKCKNGCFKCIYSSSSSYKEKYLNKKGTLLVLDILTSQLKKL